MARVPPPLGTAEGPRWLVARGLAAVWVLAFASLAVQVDGLFGPDGIVPLAASRARAAAALDGDVLALAWHLPSLLWVLPASWGPLALCVVGLGAAVAMGLGRAPAVANLVAWACYRSLVAFGAPFLAFQWDALLLETGLLATAVLPWRRTPTRQAPVLGWWILRVLLVRVVFLSAVVKLASGDPTWRDLSALTHHFATQPLPNVLGWHADHLPWLVLAAATAATLLVEGPVALGLLGPRRVRVPAAGAIAALMVVIAATGSYGFFQVLVLVLCLSVLDDDHLARARLGRLRPAHVPAPASRWAEGGAGALLAGMVALSVAQGLPRYAGVALPPVLSPVSQAADTLALGQPYGLFAVMTTARPLPVLEARWGDGPWTELRWRWQTSDPHAAPRQVAPHMPRLDWQLWFAGLGACERHPWLMHTMDALLAGSAPVARLVGDPRLLARRPDALRVRRYTYTPTATDRPDGAWWTREGGEPYCAADRTRDGWTLWDAPP